ncbi:hypothetical protein MPSEU_000998600 [Mayamaea pseudoterrestris]|nr:hypothetical protein MPSEU_000998600 [Mayamaea pseudoterrestris]
MTFFPRSSLAAALVAAACVSFVPSTLAQDTCQLCPSGSTMNNVDKPFYGTGDNAPATCGGFDELLALIPADSCEATLESQGVLSPVNLRVYCECSGVDAPNVCDLCNGGDLIAGSDEPSQILAGYTCNQINDLFASSTEADNCGENDLSAAAALCCEGGTGLNITFSDDDAVTGGNMTAMPDSNSTMAPTSNGGDENATAICQICADGSDPTNDATIPLLEMSCSVFQAFPIPVAVCSELKSQIAIGALCGCAGEEPPNACPLCGDGQVSNSSDLVNVPNGGSLTCQDALMLSMFAGENLCNSSVQELEAVCCVDASAATVAPTPAEADSPVAAPTAGSGSDTSEPTAAPIGATNEQDSSTSMAAQPNHGLTSMVGGFLIAVVAAMM